MVDIVTLERDWSPSHLFYEIEPWNDDVVLDKDYTHLWRGHRATYVDDIMMLLEDVALVMGHCTFMMM